MPPRRTAVASYVLVALASVGLASVQPTQADVLAVGTVAIADEVGTWAVDTWDAASQSLADSDSVEAR